MVEQKQTTVSSGIAGLDEILRGGLPESNLYIVQGAPGSGKTTAALQFLRAGAANGERCIYVSLSQTRAELEAIALSHGWTLNGIRVEELSASDSINRAADQTIFQTAELRLDETRKMIESAIEEHKPSRLVYDSLLEIRLITGDSPRFPPRAHRLQGVPRQTQHRGSVTRHADTGERSNRRGSRWYRSRRHSSGQVA